MEVGLLERLLQHGTRRSSTASDRAHKSVAHKLLFTSREGFKIKETFGLDDESSKF